jgi:hypothetical protein
VYRGTCAGTGDPIAGLNVRNPLADGNYRTGAAVSRTLRLVQASSNGVNGRYDAITLDLRQDFPYEIGARARFLEQSFARELGGSALRTGGNNRSSDPNQNAAGQQLRRGDVVDRNVAGASVLENLFHADAIRGT